MWSASQGIKGIQCLRHLMRQLGLPDIDCPTPVLNDNRGSIDWIDSGCKPTKKLRHENLAELGIAEAKEHGEVSFYWIPGKTNPADVFTKEDNDVGHCCGRRDPMVKSRETFCEENKPSDREEILNRNLQGLMRLLALRATKKTCQLFHTDRRV